MSQRDHHGLARWFYHQASDQQAPTLRQLFADGLVPCRLDIEGVRAHLGLRPLDATTTCFAGVSAVRPGCVLSRQAGRWAEKPIGLPSPKGRLIDILSSLLDRALSRGTALALGGGLDSALLLALVRLVLDKSVPVFSLCPLVGGYNEREAVLYSAAALGVRPELLEVTEGDLVAALPDCVGFAEVPLYNLHPVSKLVFARLVRERGIHRVITGDGADQVFAGVPGWDYLPIVGALFAGAGVSLCCPFLHPRVVAWGETRADPAKSALRDLARRVLPEAVAEGAKIPQLAPEMDLSSVAEPRYLALARQVLGDAGNSDVRLVSLALLYRHFPRLLEGSGLGRELTLSG
jgi:asparagine synthetase B (glutamine-hydrolysing)